MKLKEFIVPDAVVPELQATSRDDAIRELVTALSSAGAVDASIVDEVVAALIKREQNGTTGFGKGVAVPHVKHAKVKQMAGAVGRSAGGIDFGALDKQPVYSVFLLLSPAPADDAGKAASNQRHLQAMNIIFQNLQKEMFRKFLRQSDTRQKLADLLDEADAGK
jgi:mannitol/fructose-specific phosphotransferase system IIA component (Ntr-type)